MNLDIGNWKEFKFNRLIDNIYKAKALNKDDLLQTTDVKNSIRYITRTGENNGCEMLADISSVEAAYIQKRNAITVGDTTATCFYQSEDFITGDHMVVIRAEWLNEILALYIVAILNKEQYKYSYGRAFLIERIKNTPVKLPVKKNTDGSYFIDHSKKYSDEGYVPDWEWMESCIKSLHHKPLTTQNKSELVSNLDVEKWKEFVLGDYFDVFLSSGDLKIDDYESGNIPLISSGSTNNGIVGYIDKAGDGKAQIFKAGSITVDMFCNAFYQSEDFYAVSHGRVNILRPKFECNLYVGLFVCNIINQEQFKYSYGRAVYSSEISRMIIKLPVNAKGDPDWQWMENYIKSLPYGDRI